MSLAPEVEETDAADAAMVFLLLAWMIHVNGRSDAVKQYLRQGLALCRKAKFAFGEGLHGTMLAEIEYDGGCYDVAYHLHRDVLLRSEQTRHIVVVVYPLGFLGCTCCALGDVDNARAYLRRGLALQRDLLVQWDFQAVDPLHVTVIGIAALYDCCGQPETALELLAILLHHPQRGGDSERKARVLLAQVQSRLPAEHVTAVMEQAKQGQLASRYLDPQFTVDTALIDQLLQLVDQVTAVSSC